MSDTEIVFVSGLSGSGKSTAMAALEDLISVVLALEPEAQVVRLRALKDHENPDVADLHVSLDPRTLLLVRS